MAAVVSKTPELPPQSTIPVDRLYVSPSDHVYVIDNDGVIWRREQGTEQHLPASQRKAYWQHFPGPHNWACQTIKGGNNGSLYGMFEGHLFEYVRDTSITFGRTLYKWSEIPLPDAPPPVGEVKPQPILVHTARRTETGFSKPFELGGGSYVTSSQAPVAIERAGPKGFVFLEYRDQKFVLPGPSTLRVDFQMSLDNPVSIYLDPNGGNK